MPVISLVMPVYNTPEKYLRTCLDAVLGQTLGDFELIIVNDASNASHVAPLLAQYAAKDSRINLITLDRNQGVSAARNRALDSASGKYLGFVDADDLPDADYFERLLALAEDGKADMVMAGFRRFTDSGKVLKVRVPHDRQCQNADAAAKSPMFRELSYALWNKLLLRELHGKLRFRTGLALGEDIVYVAEAFLISRNAVSSAYAGYAYRVNPSSATSTAQSGVESIRNTMTILPCLTQLYSEHRPAKPLAGAFRSYVIWLFVRYANKLARVKDPELRLRLWEEYRALFPELVSGMDCSGTAAARLTGSLLAASRKPENPLRIALLRVMLRLL